MQGSLNSLQIPGALVQGIPYSSAMWASQPGRTFCRGSCPGVGRGHPGRRWGLPEQRECWLGAAGCLQECWQQAGSEQGKPESGRGQCLAVALAPFCGPALTQAQWLYPHRWGQRPMENPDTGGRARPPPPRGWAGTRGGEAPGPDVTPGFTAHSFLKQENWELTGDSYVVMHCSG